MTSQRERLEDLEDLIDALTVENERIPIIVEGDRDETSLRAVGVRGEIVKINVGMHIFNLCEELARKHRKMIILTDWDRTGGRLARSLREGFEANDMAYDLEFRAELARLCKKEIKDVEGLASYLARLRQSVQLGVDASGRDRYRVRRNE